MYTGIMRMYIDVLKGLKKVVHPPSNLFPKKDHTHDRERSATQTKITYRCFLPDLTRFMIVCYAAAGLDDPFPDENP